MIITEGMKIEETDMRKECMHPGYFKPETSLDEWHVVTCNGQHVIYDNINHVVLKVISKDKKKVSKKSKKKRKK